MSSTNTGPVFSFPGQGAPGDPTGTTLPPLDARTAPLETTQAAETKYYFCPIPATSMFRPDGFRLIFIHGVHATNLIASQQYLDREIAGRDHKTGEIVGNPHPFLSIATPEETQRYKMAVDPRGTIADELRPALEAAIRKELEEEIRNRATLQGITPADNPDNGDSEKLAGIEASVRTPGSVSGTGIVSSPKSLSLPSLSRPTTYVPPPPPSTESFQRSVVGGDKASETAAGSSSTGTASTQ